jgi:formate-dependent phosphoribosylglycinamide formyltransferase (GAR transformylase)
MGSAEQGMFRQELQRFLASSRFQPEAAEQTVPILRELLLQAARAAGVPAAIHATRTDVSDGPQMVRLCEHLLACWRDAEQAASHAKAGDPDGRSGDVFFGPRLGGARRPGAVSRDDPE